MFKGEVVDGCSVMLCSQKEGREGGKGVETTTANGICD